MVVGAGVGSFIQGDTTGGLIALAGDIGGIGMAYIGTGIYANAIASDPNSTSGLGIMAAGFVVIAGSRIFEIARPFWYANKYNSTLKDSLNYIEGLSLIPHFENDRAEVSLVYTIV